MLLFSECINFSLAQLQTGVAAVTNIGNFIEDSEVTNSAELEQEIEQENECVDAFCKNFALLQAQEGVAAITNMGIY